MKRGYTDKRAGFTILEVVLLLAVLAVLAGVMAPYTVGQINAAKKEATVRELQSIEAGLTSYHHDCGRLPATATGLAGLARNVEGLASWRGPYVGGTGDIEGGIVADAWGETYTYVNGPTIQGLASSADYLVVSPGADRTLNSVSGPGGWTLDSSGDIVLQGVTHATDDAWKWETVELLDSIEDGLAQYYQDVGSFPPGTDSSAIACLLSSGAGGWRGPYLMGTAHEVTHDPWGNTLLMRLCSQVNGQAATGRILISRGPGAPDASAIGQSWTTASNDIYRVILESPLVARLNVRCRDQALRALKLLAGQIYVANPAGSPPSVVLPEIDPWGRPYRYQMHSALSGVVYSVGSDGADDGGTDDDPAETLLWQP